MNTNCLAGLKCPECGSYEPFKVECISTVTVFDDGSDSYEGLDWEDDSACECPKCGFSGLVSDFAEKSVLEELGAS